MLKTRYTIKQIDRGFILVYAEGPMEGCNAAPGAFVFPTLAHASIGRYVMEKVDASFFQEEYEAAIRIN